MPWSVCENCNRETHWRNTSGSKLSDHRCPVCKGELRMFHRNPEGLKGRKLEKCALCDRRRYVDKKGNPIGSGQRARVAFRRGRLGIGLQVPEVDPDDKAVYPAGTLICWYHPIVELKTGDLFPPEELKA